MTDWLEDYAKAVRWYFFGVVVFSALIVLVQSRLYILFAVVNVLTLAFLTYIFHRYDE